VKKIIALLLSLILVLSLAACGSPDENKTDDPAPAAPAGEKEPAEKDPAEDAPAEKTDNAAGKITIMASQDWVKDAELALAEQFTEQTGIEVDYQIIPADQYPSVLTTKLNSGECADIFMHQSGSMDIVTLLQIEENGVDLSDEEWVTRFTPAVKDQCSVDGKCYGLTTWDVSDSYAMWYNKTIFAQYNLEVPTTFDEFMTVCQTLLDNGETPIYECVSAGWHHQLNWFDVSALYDAADPDMVKKLNNNETTLADHEIFTTVLEQMKQVADAGYFGEYYMSNAYEDLNAEMADGGAVMTCNMMGRIAEVDAMDGTYTSEDFGIFPVPYGDNQTIVETPCGPSKFIYSGSKNIDAAKQYLAFLASPESLQYLIDNEPSFNDMPFSGLNSAYSEEVKAAVAKYKTGKSAVYQNCVNYLNPQWMEIGADISSMFMGEMTPDEVISSMDMRRADQAKAAGDAHWQ